MAVRKQQLAPGVFSRMFDKVGRAHEVKSAKALTELALVVEKQAKINASSGAHRLGTVTPARPGTGPAVISGTLRRSVTHTPVRLTTLGKFEIKVGMGTGVYPPYSKGAKRRTASSKYAYYLETGLKNGDKYPFLWPAVRFANKVPRDLIFRKNFGSNWEQYL